MNSIQAVRALKSRPLAVLAAVIVFASLGNALLAGCGGNKAAESTATPPTETPATTTETTPPAGTDAATAGVDGAKIYTDKCALCHGPSGHGDGPGAAALNPKPRNHTDGSYMNTRTNDQLLEVIRNGKGAMPPWGAVLSEAEVQAVLKHVRTLAVPPYSGS